MTSAAYRGLTKVGAVKPMNQDFRGSFSLIGYTGPGKPSFVKQVSGSLHVGDDEEKSSLL